MILIIFVYLYMFYEKVNYFFFGDSTFYWVTSIWWII